MYSNFDSNFDSSNEHNNILDGIPGELLLGVYLGGTDKELFDAAIKHRNARIENSKNNCYEDNWVFERSSGYHGWRCVKCGTWIYDNCARICNCKKGEKTMKTLMMTILDKNNISMTDGMKSVKDIVLERYHDAYCVECQGYGFYVKAGKNEDVIGSGGCENRAWENAALFLMGFETD
jgi:hypothetical protein